MLSNSPSVLSSIQRGKARPTNYFGESQESHCPNPICGVCMRWAQVGKTPSLGLFRSQLLHWGSNFCSSNGLGGFSYSNSGQMGKFVIQMKYQTRPSLSGIMISGVASLDLMLGHTFYNRPCLATGMLVHTCTYI